MGDLVNLRQVKKRREKAEAQSMAQARRLLFGRTKAEKQNDELAQRRAEQSLDNAKIEDAPPID